MNTKKLIGTIIGVTAFVALIAGATFAWLTVGANITNGVYNLKSMNFIVNYDGGSEITTVPPTQGSSATPSGAKVITVKAYRPSTSTPGKMTIYLNTTSATNAIVSNGYIKYSYCIGSCSGNTFANNTKTLNTSSTDYPKVPIIVDTTLNTSETSYNLYFWLDGTKDEGAISELSYAGYISAEATQTE